MKSDVLKDLPPKITQDYYCDLSPVQVKLYEDFTKAQEDRLKLDGSSVESAVAAPKAKTHIFQALQYLRKVCNHPKLVLDRDHKEYANVMKLMRDTGSGLDMIDNAAKLPALR